VHRKRRVCISATAALADVLLLCGCTLAQLRPLCLAALWQPGHDYPGVWPSGTDLQASACGGLTGATDDLSRVALSADVT